MPSLILQGGIARLAWRIIDLSYDFNQTNYVRAGIATGQAASAGSTSISGVLDSVYATATAGGGRDVPSSGDYLRSFQYTGYGNITIYAFAQTPSQNLYYPAGYASTTVLMPWYWPDSWTIGSALQVAAGSYAQTSGNGNNSWNGFLFRINQVRKCKGLVEYPFSNVQSGHPMCAFQFNQAAEAIDAMNPSVPVGSTVTSNSTVIRKSDFNRLASALNSVT